VEAVARCAHEREERIRQREAVEEFVQNRFPLDVEVSPEFLNLS
jgi:hypothetical protein